MNFRLNARDVWLVVALRNDRHEKSVTVVPRITVETVMRGTRHRDARNDRDASNVMAPAPFRAADWPGGPPGGPASLMQPPEKRAEIAGRANLMISKEIKRIFL